MKTLEQAVRAEGAVERSQHEQEHATLLSVVRDSFCRSLASQAVDQPARQLSANEQRLAEPQYVSKPLKSKPTKTADVLLMSRKGENGDFESIDSAELADRLGVPPSWVRNRTRARTPKAERIPCVRFGRYVRFEWGSARLQKWIEEHRD